MDSKKKNDTNEFNYKTEANSKILGKKKNIVTQRESDRGGIN